jgi:hypothetical protein
VEVNQRALIDKVLARYSGEFTGKFAISCSALLRSSDRLHNKVFRELLQNSDDAASKAVEIHFETQAFLDIKSGKRSAVIQDKLPELKTVQVRYSLPALNSPLSTHDAQLHQWTFKNNGMLFTDEDWNRLKKIGV